MPDPVLALDSVRVSVAPGAQARVTVSIANAGTVVEGFRLSVLGDGPSRWAEVTPAEVSLLPKQEATATVVFSPPSGATAPSGVWPFGILARSTVDPDGSSVVEGDVEIGQVYGMQAKITPVTSSGRWRGRHVVQLTNYGNTPARLRLVASDPDAALGFLIRPPVVDLPLNGSATARLWVRARKPFLRGSPVRVPFSVVGERLDAAPTAGPTPFGASPDRPSVEGALNQKPILSKGFVTLLGLLVVGVLALGGVLLFLGKPDPLQLQPGSPAAPAGFRVEAVDAGTVRLNWRGRPGVDRYEITVTANGVSQPPTREARADAEEVLITGLDADTAYCFDLVAVRKDQRSAPATECLTTEPSVSPTPTPSDTPSPSGTPEPSADPALLGKYVGVVNAYQPQVPARRVEREIEAWAGGTFDVTELSLTLYRVTPLIDNPFPPGVDRLLALRPETGDEDEALTKCANTAGKPIVVDGVDVNQQCVVFWIKP